MKLKQADYFNLSRLRELAEKHRVPGFNYTLIKSGRASAPRAFGIRARDPELPVLAGTVFEAASLTKTMFAVLVLRMADRGLMDMDAPLWETAPHITISEDDRVRRISARQVLCHGSGLPNWGAKPRLQFKFDPGTGFSYSGEGYYYLQKVLEHISGKSFVRHFRDEFFDPLGMDSSSAVWTPQTGVLESRKFDEEGNQLPFRERVDEEGDAPEPNAAWSLYSGAEDYAKFLISMINDRGGLSAEAFNALGSAQNRASEGICWGLGWGIPDGDKNLLWHWGDNGAYRSFAAFDKDSGDGACIFTNSFGGTALCLELLSDLTDSDCWDAVGNFIEHAEDE